MSTTIRALNGSDLETAASLLRFAFQRPGKWLDDLQFLLRLQPDGYFGSFIDDNLVGMVGSVIYPDFAYVGMMGVHPDFQHKGLGLALMQHLLEWLDRQNVTMTLLDASKSGKPLYEKLGFISLGNVFNFQKQVETPSCQLPDKVQLLSFQDLDLISDFDRDAFGTDRTKVLQALVQIYPERAFLLRNNGQIIGYIIAQDRRIGPWVALDETSAEILLRAVLSLPFNSPASLYVPDINSRAVSLLQRFGFEIARTNNHMLRGAGELLDRRDLVFGQASLSMG